jgi:hypothetical protein
MKDHFGRVMVCAGANIVLAISRPRIVVSYVSFDYRHCAFAS